ncbi:hypothetical protein H2200_002385 [Cladophialophora chaetospira]|uniref:Phytanoyl-CoA dioxygenase n=1 Tax=Cladophialophora chaetospira TaxID=386627 RepID=A0AA38XIW8_9EURO|nr:hypothetical protein H2200_002385 [Cladophialophora chaetospira]
MARSPNLEALERDGFIVIRSALTTEQIQELRDACQKVTAMARKGEWSNVRTLPKQFPPWNIPKGTNPAAEGIWGVQGMMHPSMLEHELFTATYFSDALINPTKELLQCEDDELVMELFNLLVRPDHNFELRWHRDDISEKATPEEELQRLGTPAWHTQWNLALYDDESLIVIPGSHRRARTDTERQADPYENGLPDELHVQMSPGDVVFYNNNILHRGAYNSEKERMTLHGSVGHVKGESVRARNVLQHGLRDWVDQCDFSKLPTSSRGRAEGMRRRLIELARKSGDVGYSLDG